MFGSKRIAQRVVESAVSVEFIERARCGCAEDSARYSKLRLLVVTVVLFCATIMPARARTITVTNTNDNGPGSLRQALHDANDGDTINFAVTGTITLTSGGLPINKSITISGPGADQLSIDGNQAIVVFGVFFGKAACHLIFLQLLAKPPCVSTSKAVCKFPDFGSLGPLTRLSFHPMDSLLIC